MLTFRELMHPVHLQMIGATNRKQRSSAIFIFWEERKKETRCPVEDFTLNKALLHSIMSSQEGKHSCAQVSYSGPCLEISSFSSSSQGAEPEINSNSLPPILNPRVLAFTCGAGECVSGKYSMIESHL